MNAHTEQHVITFTRDMDRALQVKSYRNSVDLLIDGIATKSMTARGWSFDEDMAGCVEDTAQTEVARRYSWSLNVDFASATIKPGKTEFASIVYTLYARAIKPAGGRWILSHVDGAEYAPPSGDDTVSDKIEKELIGYADCAVPEEWDAYFEHLYGLDSHISRVKTAINAAIASNFRNRFNTVLVGPPGCGKSDIALSMKAALGDDAVMSFDATATTAAGLIKTLNDLEIMPRVLVLEEIEKASPDALTPLLGIADQRGEINKTTARGEVQKSVKCLVVATVNDFELFCKLQAGALESRFPNKVFFSRPPREISARILRREIEKVEGDQDWAAPALDYCEENGIHDVRQMIAICLCGADGLLDGSFQKMMEETSRRSQD
jgi:hypothetical protein